MSSTQIMMILTALLASPISSAGVFSITNRTSDLSTSDPASAALRDLIWKLADKIEDTINNTLLSPSNQATFLRGFGDSHRASCDGMGADYSSNAKQGVLGLNVTGSAQASGLDTKILNHNFSVIDNPLPKIVGTAQAGVLVGFSADNPNSRKAGNDSVMVYFNFFQYHLMGVVNNLDAQMLNFGAHVQYHVIRPKPPKTILFSWGGVYATAGAQYSDLKVNYANSIIAGSPTETLSDGSTVRLYWNDTFTLTASSKIVTVPFELSSNMTLLSFLTLFGGVGVDVSVGSSSISGNGNGPIVVGGTYKGTSTNLFSGTGQLTLDPNGGQSPTFLVQRAFGGVQLNFWKLRLLSQVDFSSDQAYSGLFGVRVAF